MLVKYCFPLESGSGLAGMVGPDEATRCHHRERIVSSP